MGTNSSNKRKGVPLSRAFQAEKAMKLWRWLVWTTTGWFKYGFKSSIFRTEEICSAVEQSWKKVFPSATTKSTSLLQLEHGFCRRKEQTMVKYSIRIQMKKRWWAPFTWMVDVVLQNTWVLYHINIDEEDESLPLLVFWGDVATAIFMKYSKEGRLSLNPVENMKCFVRYPLWWHKTLGVRLV